MKVIVFGATGMLGHGVLRECLLDPGVEEVLAVGRRPSGQTHAKLHELVMPDLFDYRAVQAQLSGFDACFFCLGVSSVGMKEDDYRRVTHDLTLAAATVLARLNPAMTFVYITGASTDSTGAGPVMWARIKGQTENALFKLPFKAAYMLRPSFIQPLHGAKSKTPLYQAAIVALTPVMGWMVRRWPDRFTTTERIGRAMLALARGGSSKTILDPPDINTLAR